jgi:hypothetical protein
MSDDRPPPYVVDHMPPFVDGLRDLTARATAVGLRSEFLTTLHETMNRIRTNPAGWGDPLRSTCRQDGIV